MHTHAPNFLVVKSNVSLFQSVRYLDLGRGWVELLADALVQPLCTHIMQMSGHVDYTNIAGSLHACMLVL